jgi:hypothetical protein
MVGEGSSNLQLLCAPKTFLTNLQGLTQLCVTCKQIYFALVIADHVDHSATQIKNSKLQLQTAHTNYVGMLQRRFKLKRKC